MTQPAKAAPSRKPIGAIVLALVAGLILGFIALEIVNAGIAVIWESIPGLWSTTPYWYVILVLVVAAVLVYLVRRNIGDKGHLPLNGIAIAELTPRAYVGVILAIVASLWGGVVLGPEVALVSTGSMVGTVIAMKSGHTDSKTMTTIVSAGALGAILALFVGPLLTGDSTLNDVPKSVEYSSLAWAVLVALITAVAITLARLLGAVCARVAGNRPHLPILLVASLVVAACAILMNVLTDESVLYVLTSSETLIKELPTITSVATLAGILIFKSIAYGVSLGAGFRGGPFFPGMFVGAATGMLVALLIPNGPGVSAAIVVGVVASIIATAPMSWKTAIILGVVLGAIIGGWTLIPAALVAAVVTRLVPRWGDRIVHNIEGSTQSSAVAA